MLSNVWGLSSNYPLTRAHKWAPVSLRRGSIRKTLSRTRRSLVEWRVQRMCVPRTTRAGGVR